MRVPVIRNITVHIPVNCTSNSPAAALSSRSAAGPLPWLLDKQRTTPHDAFFYIDSVRNALWRSAICVEQAKTAVVPKSVDNTD